MKRTAPDLDRARICFFTGAGISAEAGIPTFRGQGGIWARYDFQRVACQAAFERDPETVWAFQDERRRTVSGAEPTEAHRIIARLQAARPGVTVVTQNIDGLHDRAGAGDVIELHGSLWRVRCACPSSPQPDHSVPGVRRCPACGAWRRPDIVWFGDMLNEATVAAAAEALVTADVVFSIGTSGVVHPAAGLLAHALETAYGVEINPEPTELSPAFDETVRESASVALAERFPAFA